VLVMLLGVTLVALFFFRDRCRVAMYSSYLKKEPTVVTVRPTRVTSLAESGPAAAHDSASPPPQANIADSAKSENGSSNGSAMEEAHMLNRLSLQRSHSYERKHRALREADPHPFVFPSFDGSPSDGDSDLEAAAASQRSLGELSLEEIPISRSESLPPLPTAQSSMLFEVESSERGVRILASDHAPVAELPAEGSSDDGAIMVEATRREPGNKSPVSNDGSEFESESAVARARDMRI